MNKLLGISNWFRNYLYLCILTFALILPTQIASQELYQKLPDSIDTVKEPTTHIPVTGKMMTDALRKTGYQYSDLDMYAYEHQSGNISIGDHDRGTVAFYSPKGTWLETRQGSHSLSKSDIASIKSIASKFATTHPEYRLSSEDLSYVLTKITNRKGFWIEIDAYRKEGDEDVFVQLVFDRSGKFIKEN
ncbi:MAG: hypothetical protein JJT78_09055 [Leptospira sp.]|nr:hypothetical protein [Leptospira sp.]